VDLYILRHGEAGNPLSVAAKDEVRTLTVDGKKEVEKIASSMARLDLKFDRVISSPLSRSRETAEIVAKVLKFKPRIEYWDELRPEGDRKGFVSRLAKLGHGSCVLVVGHEPYLSTFISEAIGARGGRIILKKAGLARVKLTAFLPVARGELRWLLSPRVMNEID
jgi:phosphohistidine phosphatase